MENKKTPENKKNQYCTPVVVTKSKNEINELKKKADEQHKRMREESGHGECIALG